jgi:bleomycin hydrolase
MSVRNISSTQLTSFKEDFSKDPSNKLVQNVLTKNKISDLTQDRDNLQKFKPIYNLSVEPRLSVTNQKSSGRCWLFAAMNVMRRVVVKKFNLDDFELSQNYLFFWDKLERMNYNLDCIIQTRHMDVNSRMVQHLLSDPSCDGGQWDMVVNLVEKYGLVPKDVFQETQHSSNSAGLNDVITKKFREWAHILRNFSANENEIEHELTKLKDGFVMETYSILCKFLGTPPDTFNWEFKNKDKEYKKFENLTPQNFYTQFVKPEFNISDYICVVNDPRQEHPYSNTYTVKYLGNVIEGREVKYLKLKIERIKELVLDSLRNNQAVWFGCDVGQYLNKDTCSMDDSITDRLKLFGYDSYGLDKEQRLNYKDSLMTHAMVITGANTCERQLRASYYEIENSWDKHGPMDGYYTLDDKWFDEFVYEVAINKHSLNHQEFDLLNEEVKCVLDPWDPMGALA